jgi:phosphatidylglycerophosphatase A
LRGKATAALDISDGLLADCGHIAWPRRCARVERERVPLSGRWWLSSASAAPNAALSGGDDYVLAFTLPSVELSPLLADGWPIHVIGRIGGAGRDTARRDGQDITPQTRVINIFGRHRDRSSQTGPAEVVPPSVWRNPWHFLAFGFGSGTLPKAPGTWGSLVALPFIPLWQMLPDWGYWLMLGITMLFGFWLCGKVADDLRVHDHEGIVWDEMVGMWITLWLVPEGWQWLLAGFLMFRFFDILKPWPIRWIDRHVHGGVGIMLDDVLAGVFAWLAMQGLVWIFA